MVYAALKATAILVVLLLHQCVMGSYMITSNAATSVGDRGYSLLKGLVYPTLSMLVGFYDLLIDSRAAAFQPKLKSRWCNIWSRFKAYVLQEPEPHPSWRTRVCFFLDALVGGYPSAIARGETLPPAWFLDEAHIVPQTFFYILVIDVFACALHSFKPFLAVVSDGYAFVGGALTIYSLFRKIFRSLQVNQLQQCLPY